jgi:hypothetical protein
MVGVFIWLRRLVRGEERVCVLGRSLSLKILLGLFLFSSKYCSDSEYACFCLSASSKLQESWQHVLWPQCRSQNINRSTHVLELILPSNTRLSSSSLQNGLGFRIILFLYLRLLKTTSHTLHVLCGVGLEISVPYSSVLGFFLLLDTRLSFSAQNAFSKEDVCCLSAQ